MRRLLLTEGMMCIHADAFGIRRLLHHRFVANFPALFLQGLVKEMKGQVGNIGGGADSEKKAELEEVLLGAGEASKAVGRFSESTGYFREIIDQVESGCRFSSMLVCACRLM
jgi:hypothetical protein